ncbi:cardiolipin synthase [Shewanella fidelis]|uniref:Cardiolipin synthase A n=1 Tax=Shewanella fidelis TaxID=173509 RepID=A0AAW8NKW2_9GAMM|nr:cardiolipin synthase [Shewanella fidelis]MDR8523889.1 cardiolipin synthase [Shewanella fidelis]MDW4810436.1 cardiolipin synthase [Shewanella fidelis]MDW4814557.1 cardiolipin synthase [Shewanella fidelis]MDW4818647.1 cardiolipin synthase [Shewanella fidelis]MDW4823676.1 cardiolipin synthase [Shewanella fidelis]
MYEFYQLLTIAGVFVYWLVIAGISIRVVAKRRSIGVSLAWLMIIYIVPLGGAFAYLLFGELNLGKKRALRAELMFKPYGEWFKKLYEYRQYRPHVASLYGQSISAICEKQVGIPALADNHLTLCSETYEILDQLIADINQAKCTILLEFYIWHPGGRADDVANALIQSANRGVQIRLLLDAAGSRHFFKSHWPKQMKASGIQVISALEVSPFRMFFRRLDLRLHRKIVVIDNVIGYTGSMNLVDPKYFNQDAGVGQWIDVMVRITGPSVPVLNSIHAWDWEVETNQRFLPEPPTCLAHDDSEITDLVQVIPSGPGMREEVIHRVLLQSIYQAQKSIVITTPYFVPSDNLHMALVIAAQRNVQVDIIIPDKNDSIMVEWASRAFFSELLEAGVNIHRFKGGLLHTKSVVIDSNHCLIGTVNWDMRSLWLNFEVTLAVDNLEFTETLQQVQQGYLADADQICPIQWEKRSLANRTAERLFYLFSPLL